MADLQQLFQLGQQMQGKLQQLQYLAQRIGAGWEPRLYPWRCGIWIRNISTEFF